MAARLWPPASRVAAAAHLDRWHHPCDPNRRRHDAQRDHHLHRHHPPRPAMAMDPSEGQHEACPTGPYRGSGCWALLVPLSNAEGEAGCRPLLVAVAAAKDARSPQVHHH